MRARSGEHAFNGRDLGLVDAITAPDFVHHTRCRARRPGPRLSVGCWSASGMRPPDAHLEIKHLASDGATVICIGTMSGTHEGLLLGVSATGGKVEWRRGHVYRFDNEGRTVEHDAIRDDLSLLCQFDGGCGF